MNILYDRNMMLGDVLFPRLGRAKAIDGRTLTRADLKGCDLLFVRSTCRLTRDLLEGTDVRFVGSGVAGTDHIDFAALRALGIPVETAPGCNAESVADFVVAALLAIGERQGRSWEGATLGIVGVGHVGSIVKRFAEEALGMRALCCDPPRQEAGDWQARGFVSLETLLPQADVLTFHTPLNEGGPHNTRGLFSGPLVRKTKPGAVLLNFARGPICDDALVAAMLSAGLLSDAAIDCWEGEPDYPSELAALAALATPHVAGHAFEGRANGTLAVYRAACAFLGADPGEPPAPPPPPAPELTLDCTGKTDEQCLRAAVRAVCDIEADTARFRAAYAPDAPTRRANFDALRRTYPLRRLFPATTVRLAHPSPTLAARFAALGFAVCEASPIRRKAPPKAVGEGAPKRAKAAPAPAPKRPKAKPDAPATKRPPKKRATPKAFARKPGD